MDVPPYKGKRTWGGPVLPTAHLETLDVGRRIASLLDDALLFAHNFFSQHVEDPIEMQMQKAAKSLSLRASEALLPKIPNVEYRVLEPPAAISVVDTAVYLFARLLHLQDRAITQLLNFIKSSELEKNSGRKAAVPIDAIFGLMALRHATITFPPVLDSSYSNLGTEVLFIMQNVATFTESGDPFTLAAMDGQEPSPDIKALANCEEPPTFFFIVFGLVYEVSVTSSADPSASPARQSLVVSALQALKCVVRPEYSGKAIEEPTIFEDLFSLCYRIAMTEPANIQIHSSCGYALFLRGRPGTSVKFCGRTFPHIAESPFPQDGCTSSKSPNLPPADNRSPSLSAAHYAKTLIVASTAGNAMLHQSVQLLITGLIEYIAKMAPLVQDGTISKPQVAAVGVRLLGVLLPTTALLLINSQTAFHPVMTQTIAQLLIYATSSLAAFKDAAAKLDNTTRELLEQSVRRAVGSTASTAKPQISLRSF
ncbi:hypothetical protein H0H81_010574 [Sphagnurus paluster]|uniref:LAA1-like C-terminal TPR repeats domain-containing protein n=1 Tax=Sphagnurus paluster TaxID=117069 RepID=A0A9P7KKT7_9AGAR|nr:hypothetical protein H0H81_010574 [Sphagnurus paluster]